MAGVSWQDELSQYEREEMLGLLSDNQDVRAGPEEVPAEEPQIDTCDDVSGGFPLIVRMSDVQPEEVDWLWRPYIPIGKLTLLEGDPGVGKTFFALQIASIVSNGHPFPSGHGEQRIEAGSVVYMSAEDGLADTLRPRLDAAGADVSKIAALIGWKDEEKRTHGVTLADLPIIEQTMAHIRPVLMVIDPLQAYLGGKVDMHRANEVRPLLSGIAALAETYRCAVLMVRHLGKSGKDRSIYRGLGSIDFAAAARSIILAGVDPQDETKKRRVIAHVKSSLAPIGPSLGYEIDEGGYHWTGISEVSVEALLAPTRDEGGGDSSALDEAISFLEEILRDGSMPSEMIFKEGKVQGISEKTLRRAKNKLRVNHFRESEGNKGKGVWLWMLPFKSSK